MKDAFRYVRDPRDWDWAGDKLDIAGETRTESVCKQDKNSDKTLTSASTCTRLAPYDHLSNKCLAISDYNAKCAYCGRIENHEKATRYKLSRNRFSEYESR